MEYKMLLMIVVVIIINEVESKKGNKHAHPWKWDDYEYDRCPMNDYCSSYYDECTSEKGWEVRCKKCPFYQTCMRDSKNVLDDCDDVYVCKDIEAFKQGIGSFVTLVSMSVVATILGIVAVFMCCQVNKLNTKLEKANNKSSRRNIVTSLYPVKDSTLLNPRDEQTGFNSPPPAYDEQRNDPYLTVRMPSAPNPFVVGNESEGVFNGAPPVSATLNSTDHANNIKI